MEIKNDFIDGQEVLAEVEELNKGFLLDKTRMDSSIVGALNQPDCGIRIGEIDREISTIRISKTACQTPTFKIDQEQMEEAKKTGERMRKEMQDAVDHLNYINWRKEMVAQGYEIE